MKNSTNHHSKIKLISALATLGAVMLLVAAVPLFVNAQTGNPPNNNVDATFHSVTINDGVTPNLILKSDGHLEAPSGLVSLDDGLFVRDQLAAFNGIAANTIYGSNSYIWPLSANQTLELIGGGAASGTPADSPNKVLINGVLSLPGYSSGIKGYISNTASGLGSATQPGIGSVTIEDQEGVVIRGKTTGDANVPLDIQGKIINTDATISGGDVIIDDNLNLQGSLYNSDASVNGGSIIIDDNATVNDNLQVVGSIGNSSTGNNPVRVDDADGFSVTSGGINTFRIDGAGQITNPSGSNTGAVYVNDTLWTKTLTAMNSSGGGIFTVDSNTGNTTVTGGLNVTGSTSLMGLSAGATSVTGLTATSAIDARGGIVNGAFIFTPPFTLTPQPVSISDTQGLTVTGPTTLNGGVSGNLNVSGNITTNGSLGRFYTKWGAYTSWSTPVTKSATVSCDSALDVAISCSYYKQTQMDLAIFYLEPSGNSCTVFGHNTSGALRWFYPIVTCFDPSG